MRYSVYKAGANAGCWADIDQSGASDMMAYIFPSQEVLHIIIWCLTDAKRT